MTIPGAIWLAGAVLLFLPFARRMISMIVADIGSDGPEELAVGLMFALMGAAMWPAVLAALLLWKALSLPVTRRALVPESKDTKIARLEQRNAELERELGL